MSRATRKTEVHEVSDGAITVMWATDSDGRLSDIRVRGAGGLVDFSAYAFEVFDAIKEYQKIGFEHMNKGKNPGMGRPMPDGSLDDGRV